MQFYIGEKKKSPKLSAQGEGTLSKSTLSQTSTSELVETSTVPSLPSTLVATSDIMLGSPDICRAQWTIKHYQLLATKYLGQGGVFIWVDPAMGLNYTRDSWGQVLFYTTSNDVRPISPWIDDSQGCVWTSLAA